MEIHPIKSLNAFYCERLLWLSYSEQSSMHVFQVFFSNHLFFNQNVKTLWWHFLDLANHLVLLSAVSILQMTASSHSDRSSTYQQANRIKLAPYIYIFPFVIMFHLDIRHNIERRHLLLLPSTSKCLAWICARLYPINAT